MTRTDRSARCRTDHPESSAAKGAVPTAQRAWPQWPAGLSPAFAWALAGGMLLWAALPPLSWWPLGWLAPLCWLPLIRRVHLPGRHPYVAIWLASVLYWMVVMQGIRLAHWANYLGLVAMGSYLGIYLPLFVAVARVAVHRWRVPLLIAAPVAWTGIELVRGYGPLAFSMALLAHSQVKLPIVIQASDLFGPYTVSFLIVSVATCGAMAWPSRRQRWRPWSLAPLVVLIALDLGYGSYRLGQVPPDATRTPLRVAIIQGSIDTIFEDNPDGPRETLDQYTELTVRACREYRSLDLILWPETMFPIDDLLIASHAAPQLDLPWNRSLIEEVQRLFQREMRLRTDLWQEFLATSDTGRTSATNWIFGVPTWQFGPYAPRRYNTALMVNPHAEIVGRYHKMRPVIFGEYVPFGETFPSLYHLFPLPNGLSRGAGPAVWQLHGLRLSPSICFESTMPQLIRSHVAQLSARGESPDILVNLTNDGWFWGSSILDMQLNCAIFRAVEMRRPFLVAANTGLSAWIDGNGTVLARGPRRETGTLLAEVVPDGRTSWYARWGDLPLSICVLFCLVMILTGLGERMKRVLTRRSPTAVSPVGPAAAPGAE